MASSSHGLTGADIAYLCQRAAMFCVKDAVGANEPKEISITRHHFDAALGLLTTSAHATNAEPEPPRLLLAG
jgi:SpoVK/Ycf46/Vps4 family AAA+-type ATPase